MKQQWFLPPVLACVMLACQQVPNQSNKALGAFEFAFDLDKKTVQVLPKLQTQAVLTPSQISFSQGSLGFLADVSSGVNYISATFNVNNLTSSALQDVTLIAYQKTGNRADTALKNLVDFNGTPMTAAQLDSFARAVQPNNMPSAVSPFAVNNAIADLQYFNESELTALETAANSAGELNTAGGEYLFPYGFVARSSNTSRSIAVGNNQGTITIALKLPNSNEPGGVTSSSYPRRFNMTFVAVDAPVAARMTESYEERRGISSAVTRANNFVPSIPSSNIAQNTAANPSSGIQVNGVRTAGSKTSVRHILGERAWQNTEASGIPYGVVTDNANSVYMTGVIFGNLDGNTHAGNGDVFLTKYNASGIKQWTRLLGTTSSDDGLAVSIGGSGVSVAGSTRGNLDGNNNTSNSLDSFVTTYSLSGQPGWTRQLGSDLDVNTSGVAADASGNVYVSGYTNGNLDGNTNTGGADFFLTKYNSNGVKQWTRLFGSTSGDAATGLAIDANSTLYVAGYTYGNLDGNTNTGTNTADFFLTKYNTDGVRQWTRQLGTTLDDFARGVAIDFNSNAYVTGYTSGNLDGNFTAGGLDMFVTKYNTNGIKQWTRQLGTANTDVGNAVAVSSFTDTHVHVIGTTDTPSSNRIPFVAKYDSSGTLLWKRESATAQTVFAGSSDRRGNTYLAGSTNGLYGGSGYAQPPAQGDTPFLLRFDVLTDIYK
jgi:hypothetical protein